MIKSMTYYDKDVNINNKSQPSMIKLDYVTIKIAIIAKKKIPFCNAATSTSCTNHLR